MNKLYPAIFVILLSFSYAYSATPLFSDSDPVEFSSDSSKYTLKNSNIKVEIYRDAQGYNKYYDSETNDVLLYSERYYLEYWKIAGGTWNVRGTPYETIVMGMNETSAVVKRLYTDYQNPATDFNLVFTLESHKPLKVALETKIGTADYYRVRIDLDGIAGADKFPKAHGWKFGNSEIDYSIIFDYADVFDKEGKDLNVEWSTTGNGRKGEFTFEIGDLAQGETYFLDPAIGSDLYATPIDYRACTVRTGTITAFAIATKGEGGIYLTKTTNANDATPTFNPIDVNFLADSGGVWEKPKILHDSTNNKIIITTANDTTKDLNITECSLTNTCLSIADYSGNTLGITDQNLVGTESYDCDVNSGGWLVCVWAEGDAIFSVLRYGWDTGANAADNNTDWIVGDILAAANIRNVNLKIDSNSMWEISYTSGNPNATANYINYTGETGFSTPVDFGTINTGIDLPFGITQATDGNTSIAIRDTDAGKLWELRCGLGCGTVSNWDSNSGFSSATARNGGISSDGDSNVFIFYPDGTDIKVVRRNPEYVWQTPELLHSGNDNKISISQTSQAEGYQDYMFMDAGVLYWGTFPVTAGGGAGEWISANFIYSPDPLTPIDTENDLNITTPDLNGTATHSGGVTLSSWEWTVDLNVVGTDQNIIYDFNMNADFNVCLAVGGIDGSSNDYNDMECKSIHLSEYPQDVNFTYTPTNPSIHIDINFYGEATDPNILTWDWGFPDGNITSPDINVVRAIPTIGDTEVCLTVDDNEGLSRQTCNTINLTGTLKMAFSDENTGGILVPDISIDGNTDYTADADGILSVNLEVLTAGIHTVKAEDNNHETRYWTFDLTTSSDIDINAVLLDTNKGKDIQFRFHYSDETYMPNALVSVIINDTNHASIRQTDNEGLVTFFLNPQDQNYMFRITDANGTDYNYFLTDVSIFIPLDEDTGATITPFGVGISGISDYSFPYNITDVNVPLFSDTLNYHVFDINATGYYARNYSEIFEGGLDIFNLQPYLVSTTGGVNPRFNVVDFYSRDTIPDVLIISRKSIGGTLQIVESAITDSTGRAKLSFIQGDTYELEFWHEGELKLEATLVPDEKLDYYVYLDLQQIGTEPPDAAQVEVEFTPSDGEVDEADNGLIHLEQLVTPDVNNITSVRILIIYDINTVLFDETYTGTGVEDGNNYTQDINTQGLATYKHIHVEVTVNTTTGTFYGSLSYHINSGVRYNIFRGLQNFTVGFGQAGTTIIALLITLVAVGAFTVKGLGSEGGFFLAAAMIGFFVFIGWVDLLFWVFGVAAGLAAIILIKRF